MSNTNNYSYVYWWSVSLPHWIIIFLLYYSIDSLRTQSSQESDGDTLSAVQETDPYEESFSSVTSNTETILVEEHHTRPMLNYSCSYCVPYTDEEHGIL